MFLWKSHFRKWEDMSFLDILQQHVHDYYRNKSMQQIYGYNIFPVVQDQIRYDGETNPPALGTRQPGSPKQNISRSIAISSVLTNPQFSALSVERLDIIEGHAQMLCHDLHLSYCKGFLLFFVDFLFLFRNMIDCWFIVTIL